jgi:hypothetical protein
MELDSPSGKPPTQFELAQLAAIISATRERLIGYPSEVSRLVRTALNIWYEAGDQLSSFDSLDDVSRQRLVMLGRYREAILVGKHFLPEIPVEFLKNDHCELDEFLVTVIGLSEKADRMKWFRAFLDNWTDYTLKSENQKFPWKEVYLDISRRQPRSGLPQVLLRDVPMRQKDEKIIILDSENLPSFRENGISEPASMAKAFRTWRLSMKNATTKASKPASLEICIILADETRKR